MTSEPEFTDAATDPLQGWMARGLTGLAWHGPDAGLSCPLGPRSIGYNDLPMCRPKTSDCGPPYDTAERPVFRRDLERRFSTFFGQEPLEGRTRYAESSRSLSLGQARDAR